jgi:uncharacterized YigZ family protein
MPMRGHEFCVLRKGFTMADTSYHTVLRVGTGEIVEKKSRFIGVCAHVESEEEAAAFLNSVRKRHYDAKHHCSAMILGKDASLKRSSDDGEPQGTAGHPMLALLEGGALTDTIVVVTRYFGGTLLGTGGLVRCYSAAAKAALDDAVLIEKKPGSLAELRASYNDSGKVTYLLAQEGIPLLDTIYEADVCYRFVLPAGTEGRLKKLLAEASAGRLVPAILAAGRYSEADGAITFEKA